MPQRNDTFVPLTSTPPAGESREFRIQVIPQPHSAPAFQALEPASPQETGAAPGGKNCEPRLLLQREGDRITSIRVQCSCGQIMDLACVYAEPPKTA